MKTNRGRAGTSTSVCEPSTSTEQGAHRNTLLLYAKKEDKDDLVLFVKFCSIGKFCSMGGKFRVSATFEVFILIPTGSKSFGQGTDLQGTESNNF